MLRAPYCLGCTYAVCVICEELIAVNRLKLSSLFPFKVSAEICCRVALPVVDYLTAVICCKTIFLPQLYNIFPFMSTTKRGQAFACPPKTNSKISSKLIMFNGCLIFNSFLKILIKSL